MAHQYMEQLDETVLAAVIGNVGTILTFRVGSVDAEQLAKEFVPTFEEPDLINLAKFNIYLKLMIDGVSSRPFSANTLPPIGRPTGSSDKVIKVSRERYALERDKIEDKIARWSGMEGGTEEDDDPDSEPKPNIFVPDNKKVDKPTGANSGSRKEEAPKQDIPKKQEQKKLGDEDIIIEYDPDMIGKKKEESKPIEKVNNNRNSGSGGGSRPDARGSENKNPSNNKKRRRSKGKDRRPTPVIINNPNERGMSLTSLKKDK